MRFSKIGILGKYTNPEVKSTISSLVKFLQSQGLDVIVEQNCAESLADLTLHSAKQSDLGTLCDLAIVVGGDGSFLDAARALVEHDVPMIGVNRGRRGFLTDISPQALTIDLMPILVGQFQEEHRFLLEMRLLRQEKEVAVGIALNDVVIYSGDIAKMIEFEVLIDNQFVYRQRSDGLITSTPTGSTAYALAGGGPILHPQLNAIVLVPMHPPILSSRPIVVTADAQIEVHLMPINLFNPRLSCDGQVHFDTRPGDRILIQRKAKPLRLLHPTDYDYYHTLRTKLGWTA